MHSTKLDRNRQSSDTVFKMDRGPDSDSKLNRRSRIGDLKITDSKALDLYYDTVVIRTWIKIKIKAEGH